MKKEKLNVFVCKINREKLSFIATGYNRGHAAKQIAKQLEARNLKLEKSDLIEQLDLEKAQVILLS